MGRNQIKFGKIKEKGSRENLNLFSKIVKLESFMQFIFFISACASIIAILLICVFLFENGFSAISKIGFINFIFGTVWKPSSSLYGIFPMIIASIYVTMGAIIIGVPIGLFSSVFLVFYCSKKLYKIIKSLISLLAGIPSIIYGFFGLVVLVPMIQRISIQSGKNILTASILLGIMILPTIVSISESSLKAVESDYYKGALALGATKERSIFTVVIPAAKSGILAGIVLGIGRAIGETMAVIMVAGNQAIIPSNLFSGIRTLTANIVLEMGYATDLHREALIATGVILFIFILIINVLFSVIVRRKKK